MSRIEYDLFCTDHPEYNLPCWNLLWDSDINKIHIMSRHTLLQRLAENTLVGRLTFSSMKGSRATIFDVKEEILLQSRHNRRS